MGAIMSWAIASFGGSCGWLGFACVVVVIGGGGVGGGSYLVDAVPKSMVEVITSLFDVMEKGYSLVFESAIIGLLLQWKSGCRLGSASWNTQSMRARFMVR